MLCMYTLSTHTQSHTLTHTPTGGFPQFVSQEGYEGGGGLSPLTPPYIVGHGHPLMEGLEIPPEFIPALGLPLDGRVGHTHLWGGRGLHVYIYMLCVCV